LAHASQPGINTEDNLKTELRSFAESKWKEQFDYQYKDTPGDFEGGAAATLVRHGDLLYLPEGSVEDTANRVANFVNVEFFGSVLRPVFHCKDHSRPR
jgi:hypothetical protein